MSRDKGESGAKFNREKDEGLTKLLHSSLTYALEINKFDGEKYYVEDVTAVSADFRALILGIIGELVANSEAVTKEFREKYANTSKG